MTYKQAQERYGIQGRSYRFSLVCKHGQLDWSKGIEQLESVRATMSNSSLNSNPRATNQRTRAAIKKSQFKLSSLKRL